MNIFEENKKKYEIKTAGDMIKMGFALLFAGGVLFVIGLPLSFFIIGFPIMIFGVIIMFLGVLMILLSPFYKKFKKISK